MKLWPLPPRVRVGIGSVAVAATGIAALLSTGVHANASETAATSPLRIRQAQYNDAYYACLRTQAHALIGPKSVVYLPHPSLDEWAIVTKVIGGWAHVTLVQKDATMALVLGHWTGAGTCDGDVLVGIVRHHGRTEFVRPRVGSTS